MVSTFFTLLDRAFSSGIWSIAVVAALISLVAVLTKDRHAARTDRGYSRSMAVQSNHSVPTPRLGGVAILVAVLCAIIFVLNDRTSLRLTLLVLGTLPIFIGGMFEDLGITAGVKNRLALALMSGLAVWLLTGHYLSDLNSAGLSFLIQYKLIAVTITVIGTAGVANAFNLIDGLNGLALGQILATSLALAMISTLYPDRVVQMAALSVFFAALGVFVFNFPKGAIFLGDSGAYFCGHLLAWLAVITVIRHDEITPWAILLIFFYPLFDTFFAIMRRILGGQSPGTPDRLHFHQMTHRYVARLLRKKIARRHINPLASLVVLSFALSATLTGTLFIDDALSAVKALLVFSVIYTGAYQFMLRSLL